MGCYFLKDSFIGFDNESIFFNKKKKRINKHFF